MGELTREQWVEAQARMAVPFDPAAIDFRVADFSKAAPGGVVEVLPYADAREYMTRLDAGLHGQWSFRVNVLATYRGKIEGKDADIPLSGIGVLTLPGGVVHEAYGEASNIAAGKGLWSDCLKLCAVQAGVGRCLYETPRFRAQLDQEKRVLHTEAERLRAYLAELWGVPFTPTPAPPEPANAPQRAHNGQQRPSVRATTPESDTRPHTPPAPAQRVSAPLSKPRAQDDDPVNASAAARENATDGNAGERASANDIATIKRGYQAIGKAIPPDVERLTPALARNRLDMLAREYHKLHPEAVGASAASGK